MNNSKLSAVLLTLALAVAGHGQEPFVFEPVGPGFYTTNIVWSHEVARLSVADGRWLAVAFERENSLLYSQLDCGAWTEEVVQACPPEEWWIPGAPDLSFSPVTGEPAVSYVLYDITSSHIIVNCVLPSELAETGSTGL